jgi:hypothetical protein
VIIDVAVVVITLVLFVAIVSLDVESVEAKI